MKAVLLPLALLTLYGAGVAGTHAGKLASPDAPAAPQRLPQSPPAGSPWYVVCDVLGMYSAQGLPPEVALGAPYTRVVGQRNTAVTFMLSPVPPYRAVQYPTRAAADEAIASGVFDGQCVGANAPRR